MSAVAPRSRAASVKLSPVCCYLATSDGKSSIWRPGTVSFTQPQRQNLSYVRWASGADSTLVPDLNQTRQAGPCSVCKGGGPSWGWLFPVPSWCALTTGFLRLYRSWLVSALCFSYITGGRCMAVIFFPVVLFQYCYFNASYFLQLRII